MAVKKGLVTLVLASLSGAALADVDFRFPATGPMPLYFSGANNRISAHAHVTGETLGITAYELWIGSGGSWELTEKRTGIPAPDPGGMYVAEVNPKIMFTSAHFPVGAQIKVKLKVWTTDMEGPL